MQTAGARLTFVGVCGSLGRRRRLSVPMPRCPWARGRTATVAASSRTPPGEHSTGRPTSLSTLAMLLLKLFPSEALGVLLPTYPADRCVPPARYSGVCGPDLVRATHTLDIAHFLSSTLIPGSLAVFLLRPHEPLACLNPPAPCSIGPAVSPTEGGYSSSTLPRVAATPMVLGPR